ncbi:MAG: adenylosuccinate lyase [Oligoflexia bacterium]|nr:adenylosuccinate lyase [Oligoflexia bacterium]
MIQRYSRPEIAAVWQDQHRYLAWLKVEMAVCEELKHEGVIPRKDFAELKKRTDRLIREGGVDPKRVDHFEAITRHDVIAFTTAVAERIGPISRYIHFGLTSSDVVDTALSLLILEAGEILRKDIEALMKTLLGRAREYRDLPTIGRSHGIFAEPTSFGLKFLGWYVEWRRNLERLDRALDGVRTGKLSGAVGANPHFGPEFERKVLARLGLRREPVSTQVVPRDRHAEFLSVLAICGSSLERMAVELRHLQRSEVGEVIEGFQAGQKGSSAMPHKRNPISSENISGCARLLRSYAAASLENVALWHERDISHSSVERVAFPDATILFDYAISRMDRVIQQLSVREERIRENLEKAGSTVFSGHYLLALVKAGATREEAYAWVQSCAIGSLEGQGEFVSLLLKHPEVTKRLTPAKIRELGSLKYQLRNVREIYRQALSGERRKPSKR